MARTKPDPSIDPITLSVVSNKLHALTLDTGERIIHSAQSSVMAQARDLGIVLLDAKMDIVTQQAFLPCHCLSAGIATRAMTERLGRPAKGELAPPNAPHT